VSEAATAWRVSDDSDDDDDDDDDDHDSSEDETNLKAKLALNSPQLSSADGLFS